MDPALSNIAADMDAMIFEPVTPDYRFVYKSVDNCENGGPSMDVMLPASVKSESTVPVAM
jgi:hypothetical protein